MRLLPSSPRRRRRFLLLGGALAAAGTVALVVLLVPDSRTPSSAPGKNAPPAQLVSNSTRVPRAERRAINRTLDRFLAAALDRSSMKTAWQLAGPELRGGTSLREWQAGTSPIPYYPPRETTFHGWTTIAASPGFVVLDLLVHPRHGARTSSWVFSIDVIKRGGRWLVNGLYTIATMQRPTTHGRREVGPADFAAAAPQTGPPPVGKAVLGRQWLLVAVGLVLLVLVLPVGFFSVSALRTRRARRLHGRRDDRTLPPLPTRVRPPTAR